MDCDRVRCSSIDAPSVGVRGFRGVRWIATVFDRGVHPAAQVDYFGLSLCETVGQRPTPRGVIEAKLWREVDIGLVDGHSRTDYEVVRDRLPIAATAQTWGGC